MPPVEGLLAILAFIACGLGLVRLSPALWSGSWPIRLAWGYLLGVALAGTALYAASHWAGMPLSRPWIGGTLGALAALGTGAALVWPRRDAATGRRSGPPVALLVALVALFMALLADAVTNPARDTDGRITWTAHARYVRAAGTVDAPILTTREAIVAHPRYPLLMPLAQIATLELLAADDERAARPLYAAFWLAWALLLFDLVERWAGRAVATYAGWTAAAIPFVAFAFDGGAAGAYSDLALACFGGAGLALLLWPGEARTGPPGGVLLGAALLTKNEGAVLVGLALLAALLARPRPPARRLAGALPAVALAVSLLVSWSWPIPNRFDEDYAARLSADALGSGAMPLLGEAVPEMLRQMADWRAWGLTWLLVPVGVALALRRPSPLRTPLGLVIGGGMTAYLAACAIGPWSVEALVAVTWTRCLLQLSVPLTLLAALGVAPSATEPHISGGGAGAGRRRRRLVGALLGLHLLVGGFGTARDAVGFATQIRFAGEDARTARRRVLGDYALGLEAAESVLGPAEPYLLVPGPGRGRHLLIQGDLAPRWAHRAPDAERGRRRLERDTLPAWTVVFRGEDTPAEVLPTAQWVTRREPAGRRP